MEKIEINGVIFDNFGESPCGMDKIYFHSENGKSLELVEDVLEGKYPNVFVNPSRKSNKFEFYGLRGTKEQYDEACQQTREAEVAKVLFDKFGYPFPEDDLEFIRGYKECLKDNYKPWYNR